MDNAISREGWDGTSYTGQTTTVQNPKDGLCKFGGYFVYNPHSAVVYLQIFDVAAGTTVTLGTTVPKYSFGIPASGAANLEFVHGLKMSLGMKLAVTTTPRGLTAPATGAEVNVFFK